MQIERFGWEYEVKRHFPDAREMRRLAGETVYFAEREGRFYLIDDRSMQADFICPAQPGVDEPNWVDVIEFVSDDERQKYCESFWPRPLLNMRLDF
jgi:hypothetical protein